MHDELPVPSGLHSGDHGGHAAQTDQAAAGGGEPHGQGCGRAGQDVSGIGAKCPPATGVAKRGGHKVPGVYAPFSTRGATTKTGLNTVTVAARGKRGKRLTPGTYLLTITAGDTLVSRTKLWVLR